MDNAEIKKKKKTAVFPLAVFKSDISVSPNTDYASIFRMIGKCWDEWTGVEKDGKRLYIQWMSWVTPDYKNRDGSSD